MQREAISFNSIQPKEQRGLSTLGLWWMDKWLGILCPFKQYFSHIRLLVEYIERLLQYNSVTVEKISPRAGLELGTFRSVGQHWATLGLSQKMKKQLNIEFTCCHYYTWITLIIGVSWYTFRGSNSGNFNFASFLNGAQLLKAEFGPLGLWSKFYPIRVDPILEGFCCPQNKCISVSLCNEWVSEPGFNNIPPTHTSYGDGTSV